MNKGHFDEILEGKQIYNYKICYKIIYLFTQLQKLRKDGSKWTKSL